MATKQINEYDSLGTYTGTYQVLVDLGTGSYKNFLMSNLSPVEGSVNLVTTGTIATGTWQGTAISVIYIASAAIWNTAVLSTDVDSIVRLTQAAYDLLTPDANTLYAIIG